MRFNAALAGACLIGATTGTNAQITQRDGITSFRPEVVAVGQVDYAKAEPKLMPLASSYTLDQAKSDVVKAFASTASPAAAPGSSQGA